MRSDIAPFTVLIRFGGRFAFLQAGTVVFAIVGYGIWPHVFSDHNAEMVFEGIQRAPFEYFMRLDPIVLIGTLMQLPVYLALWAALRKAAPFLALIALAVGLVSTVACLTTRPIIELYALAKFHSTSATAAQQSIYLAAGEALLAQFHGTAWAVSIMCGGLAALFFAGAMRQTKAFRSATQWMIILSGMGALVVLAPMIGIIALFLFATIGGVAASVLCGMDLVRIA